MLVCCKRKFSIHKMEPSLVGSGYVLSASINKEALYCPFCGLSFKDKKKAKPPKPKPIPKPKERCTECGVTGLHKYDCPNAKGVRKGTPKKKKRATLPIKNRCPECGVILGFHNYFCRSGRGKDNE